MFNLYFSCIFDACSLIRQSISDASFAAWFVFINLYLRGRGLMCCHQSINLFLCFINIYLRGSGSNLYLAYPSMYVGCLHSFIYICVAVASIYI